MEKKTVPPTERIAEAYKQLSEASSDHTAAANELSETISTLDAALKTLKLGVSAWYQVAGNSEDENGNFWTRDIGYAKVDNKWGIAIRRTWGNSNVDHYGEETWLFADSPRWIAIECAGKLPDLFDVLIKRTKESTEKLKARAVQTRELIAAIAALAPEAPKKGK